MGSGIGSEDERGVLCGQAMRTGEPRYRVPAAAAGPRCHDSVRVLIVDDDEYVRDVMVMVLEGLGHSVRATGNGFEALRRLEAESYDLLILDLRMPEIDGPTLRREVLARWPTDSPRMLFVAGFADLSNYDDTLKALAVPVLVKPFTVDDLRDAVARVLTPV